MYPTPAKFNRLDVHPLCKGGRGDLKISRPPYGGTLKVKRKGKGQRFTSWKDENPSCRTSPLYRPRNGRHNASKYHRSPKNPHEGDVI